MFHQKKVVYIISKIYKSLAFEWITTGLKSDYQLSFIVLNPSVSPMEEFLLNNNVEVKRIRYRGKKDFVVAFIKTFLFLMIKRPQIVHAHLLDAQLIGLTAAKITFIQKRIYTRHNSNYHHVYHPQGIRFDLWSNRMATHIVSISQATDYTLLRLEGASPDKIVKIPHGFSFNTFDNVDEGQSMRMKRKWMISGQYPVIGVIARHIEWKGIQFIIPAFKKLLNEYPKAILILANADGPYIKTISELVKTIPSASLVIIPFEEDVAALYSTFDLYIHTPVDSLCEAFGQTYVEALAAGVPSIFTLSGIAVEFIEDNKNALVVDFKNSDSIYQTMVKLLKDSKLRRRLVENGKQDVLSRFGIEPMLIALRNLYGT
ncbi:MAG: glycosyltransferase family 4 protein [Cyclobacteriaceae bacterium]